MFLFHSMAEKLHPMKVVNPDWQSMPCRAAEPNLLHSIGRGGILVVNDSLLVKFRGDILAVAVEEKTVSEGVVHLGRWYEPHGKDAKDLLRKSYIAGMTSLHIPDSTVWFEERPVWPYTNFITEESHTANEIIETAQKAAHELTAGPRITTERQRVVFLNDDSAEVLLF